MAVGRSVGRAATAAHELGEALAEVTRPSLATGGPCGGAAARPSAATSAVRLGASAPGEARPGAPGQRGRTGALPPALFDDSFEAAEYLVRVSGCSCRRRIQRDPVVLAGSRAAGARRRLVDALAELAMRLGPAVRVVFDGTVRGVGSSRPRSRGNGCESRSHRRARGRRGHRRRGRDLDPTRPVVVATDDRRVLRVRSRRGANVISVDQLLAVLGRARSLAESDPGSLTWLSHPPGMMTP